MFVFVGGPYTPSLTTISAATMNYLRGSYANAWDVIGGGTWTPSVKSIFDGANGLQTNFSAVGLQINGLGGLHVLTGSTAYIDVGGFFVNNGTQTLNGATVYNGGVTYNSTVTVGAAGAITVNAASTTTLNGPLVMGAGGTITTNVAATSTFLGPIASSGGISVAGTISGTIALSAALTRTGAETLSGNGATTARRQGTIAVGAIAPTLDVTKDEWLILGTNPATTMVATLRSTTAPIPLAGQSMKIGRLAVGSGNVSIQREDASVLVTLDNATRSGIEVSYWPSDGGWRLMGGYEYTLGASP